MNNLNFWEKERRGIRKTLPKYTVKCDLYSEDQKKMSKPLGMDLYTQEFGELTRSSIETFTSAYYEYSCEIRLLMKNDDFINAGQNLVDILRGKRPLRRQVITTEQV